jgi:hypothetical protein
MNAWRDIWTAIKATTVVVAWLVIIIAALAITVTSLFAAPACLSKKEARAKWPDAHLYWHTGDRCWDNKRGGRRYILEREKPKPHIAPEPLVGESLVRLAGADVRAEQLPVLEKVEPIPFLDLRFEQPKPRVVLPPMVEPEAPAKKTDRLLPPKAKPLPADENAQLKANIAYVFGGILAMIAFAFLTIRAPHILNRRRIHVRRPSHRNYGINQPLARARESGRAERNGPRIEQPHLPDRDVYAEQGRIERTRHAGVSDAPGDRASDTSALGAFARARSLRTETANGAASGGPARSVKRG